MTAIAQGGSVRNKLSRDLTQPKLGLSEAVADKIFNTADAIIHNGADISYLKSYRSLKAANFEATSKLIQLALGRHIPFHFLSTAGVTFFSQRAVFGEESVSSYLPPGDGLDGYTSSKWASERYLEKIHVGSGSPLPFIGQAASLMRMPRKLSS
ncbi:hypothetical protein N7467_008145 [Penicillium canescens]|nr:hypothetical protein N7467_008145 [Penicillium canescens]